MNYYFRYFATILMAGTSVAWLVEAIKIFWEWKK